MPAAPVRERHLSLTLPAQVTSTGSQSVHSGVLLGLHAQVSKGQTIPFHFHQTAFISFITYLYPKCVTRLINHICLEYHGLVVYIDNWGWLWGNIVMKRRYLPPSLQPSIVSVSVQFSPSPNLHTRHYWNYYSSIQSKNVIITQ